MIKMEFQAFFLLYDSKTFVKLYIYIYHVLI